MGDHVNLARRRRWAEEIEHEAGLLFKASSKIEDEWSMMKWYLEAEAKRALCVLRRVRQCPECRGSGYQISYAPRGKSWHKCPTCNGAGKI